MDSSSLETQITQLDNDAGAHGLGVAFHDYETGTAWGLHADRWFHAASTIKVAVLVGVFSAIAEGRFDASSRLHVRNRFLSVVADEPYRIAAERDANAVVHSFLGRTMTIGDLTRHMIVTSSNLATNLLLDLVGLESARRALAALELDGVELVRGVEDHRAFEMGLSNRVTPAGLVRLFRLIYEGRAVSAAASEQMMEILYDQEFGGGIPAGLPDHVRAGARIAHKTGEISTVAHDAGVICLPDRQPYVLAVLSELGPEAAARRDLVARTSRVVYEYLSASDRISPEPAS